MSTGQHFSVIAVMDILPKKLKMLPRVSTTVFTVRRKWKQLDKIHIIYNSNGEAFLFKYSLNYPVTKVKFLALNYFVYSFEQLHFNVLVSKSKDIGKALISFSPSASTRRLVNCFY